MNYTWEELKPVRPITIANLIAQAVGAVVGVFLQIDHSWIRSLWVGAITATFFGFLFGLLFQAVARPGSISQNKAKIAYLGTVSLFLSAVGIAILAFILGAL